MEWLERALFLALLVALAWPAGHFLARVFAQERLAVTSDVLPSDSLQFGGLVLGAILVVGALSFMPTLALGPLLEALRP